MEGHQLLVEVEGTAEIGGDIMGGNRKRGLFEQVYGVEVVLRLTGISN
jgi:hypothetical protein